MNLGLQGKCAVITGGANGIGWACAQAFAQEECSVAIWDVMPETEERARELNRDDIRVVGYRVDVCDDSGLRSALEETEAALGPVTHLVHAAAIGSGKFGFPFTNLQPADWRKVLDVNIMGMVNVAHTLVPKMVERQTGSIVLLGSIAGQIGSQTDPPYSASKAATINFMQCLAKDVASHDIRVNVVNPGMVRTPLNRSVWAAWNQQQPEGKRRSYEDWGAEKVKTVAPLGRWQEPEDIASTIVFLSSNRARQITGQCINVDGGQVMHW
jgi:2-hydroxycyclohexanecarboxyl-CoA dehydrogenase